jgi:hypothetical protein
LRRSRSCVRRSRIEFEKQRKGSGTGTGGRPLRSPTAPRERQRSVDATRWLSRTTLIRQRSVVQVNLGPRHLPWSEALFDWRSADHTALEAAKGSKRAWLSTQTCHLGPLGVPGDVRSGVWAAESPRDLRLPRPVGSKRPFGGGGDPAGKAGVDQPLRRACTNGVRKRLWSVPWSGADTRVRLLTPSAIRNTGYRSAISARSSRVGFSRPK